MSESEKKTTFQYTYSARQQEELKKIRSKYLPKEENKMEQIRRLDAQVTMKATMHAIITGVIGSLVLGVGMCCCMVWAQWAFIPGIVVGVAGMTIVALAYPLYNRILQKERKRIAPEIIRLTDELLK